MRLKVLFREDTTGNTISCGADNNEIIGVDTKFTEQLCVGTAVEIETSTGVTSFIGNVDEITDDTHAILDRESAAGFSNKKFWIDWTPARASSSAISRGVESENEGEAGAITFDSVTMELYYQDKLLNGNNNPARLSLNRELDSVTRYLIRLQLTRVNGTAEESKTFFEGMIDFSTIEFSDVKIDAGTENADTIVFDVLDKLTALGILTATAARTQVDVHTRVGMPAPFTDPKQIGTYKYEDANGQWMLVTKGYVDETGYHIVEWDNNLFGDPDQVFFEQGEIFDRAGDGEMLFLITESFLAAAPDGWDGQPLINWCRIVPNFTDWSNGITSAMKVYDKLYYSTDIYTYDVDDIIISFDAVKLVKTLITQQWPDTVFIDHVSLGNFPVPLTYFTQLINQYPLDMDPLDALIELLDSMLCWGFFDRLGRFVTQKKDDFPTGSEKEIPAAFIREANKKIMWNKINDAVTLTVKSWLLNSDSEFYTGKATIQKGSGTKPRNELSKEVFIDKASLDEFSITLNDDGTLADPEVTDDDQELILNHYALLFAQKIFDFYGKRHSCYDITLNQITWDMLDWELADIFTLNSVNFFATNLSIDPDEETVTLSLPSVAGYDYNLDNVLIPQREDTYTSGGGGSSSAGGTVTSTTIIAEKNIGYV